MSTLLRPLKHFISVCFRPALDALWFGRHLPCALRWRLLAFQPLHVIANLTIFLPYLVRRPFTVDYIPVAPGRELRVLVFGQQSGQTNSKDHHETEPLRPLHINCHGGGFVGGYPETSVPWCDLVAKRTGAVVVSLSYRLAPVHPFPAGPDDIDAAITWLRENAATRYGADPNLITVSGFSVGGTFLLAAAQQPSCHDPAPTNFKAYVGFYPVMDPLTPPWEKPRPSDMPTGGLSFMDKLYASYPGLDPASVSRTPRLCPGLTPLEALPKRMMIVMPRLDILNKEILDFAARVDNDRQVAGQAGPALDIEYVEDGFHGYLEVPDLVVPWTKKMQVYEKGLNMIEAAHEENGWRGGF